MNLNSTNKTYRAKRRQCQVGNKLQLGFNLVELLVVIGIIALLLSILMPTLGKVKSMAFQLKCEHNLMQINLAVNLYLDGNDQMYPCAEDPLPEGYWLWMGRGWRGFIEPYLGGNLDADNPSVLFCPIDRVAKEKYESTSYGYSMAFYHNVQQIDAMSSPADTYSSPQPSVPQRSYNVAKPAGKILIGEWLSNHYRIKEDGGWWCWQGRRNYLFADGQVRFLDAEEIRPARDGFPDINLTVHGIKGIDWPQ
ncbi:MAG: type II secretion system protein [Planctomycetota bacterium]|jgi:prepilin-type N-terminal cleavage/methylation domain-containing protein/prepilin-type processing-associated H-X9-DG protein